MTSVDASRTDPFALAAADAARLGESLGAHRAAVVLGSGWAEVGAALGTTRGELAMSSLDGVPEPTVAGHGGTIRSVDVTRGGDALGVLVLAGRSHLYEGHPPDTVVHAVRTAVLHGCTTVLLTNAAGSLRSEVGVGSAVLISDQLNLSGANPMCGTEPPAEHGGRFADLSELYSRRLRDAACAAFPDLVEGVYAGVLGGSYETPAEIRMLRTLGADLVGMSTVLEAIAAHHLGAEVFGVSLVTNLAAGMQPTLDHADVLAAGTSSTDLLVRLLRAVLDEVRA
ncbi:MAG: purine-nucleoside phosphorylase [Microthrixaceae bacterium]